MNEYEIDTSVDKENLEDEWVKQADLYWKYSELANKAYDEYNDVKQKLSVAKARLEMALRTGEVELGCKITDKAIAAFLESDDTIIKLNKEVAEAKYDYEVYNSAVFAMEHKKRSLENLTKLTLNNYYTQTIDYDDYRDKMMNKPKS